MTCLPSIDTLPQLLCSNLCNKFWFQSTQKCNNRYTVQANVFSIFLQRFQSSMFHAWPRFCWLYFQYSQSPWPGFFQEGCPLCRGLELVVVRFSMLSQASANRETYRAAKLLLVTQSTSKHHFQKFVPWGSAHCKKGLMWQLSVAKASADAKRTVHEESCNVNGTQCQDLHGNHLAIWRRSLSGSKQQVRNWLSYWQRYATFHRTGQTQAHNQPSEFASGLTPRNKLYAMSCFFSPPAYWIVPDLRVIRFPPD